MFPLELPSNGHGTSSRGTSFSLLAQAANLLPKSAHPPKPILDLEQAPEIPLPFCYPWHCCCISFQPAIRTTPRRQTHSAASRDLPMYFSLVLRSTEPGTVIKQCLRPACPAEILLSRVPQSHLAQPLERFHRATFPLLSEELGVLTNPPV